MRWLYTVQIKTFRNNFMFASGIIPYLTGGPLSKKNDMYLAFASVQFGVFNHKLVLVYIDSLSHTGKRQRYQLLFVFKPWRRSAGNR